MSKIFGSLILLCLASCERTEVPSAMGAPCQPPFVDLAGSGASREDQQVLREASDDFCAVVAGKDPIHAKFDTAAALPSDGGTRFYVGRKYKLTVLNSLAGFGSFHGTAHGPIITFDEAFAPGAMPISNVRVYPLPKASRNGR